MYLQKENLEPALQFINGSLWADIKRCLRERRPPSAEPTDAPHTAAARGFQRDAWEKAMDELEKLPFEQPEPKSDPFNRPAVTEIQD